MNMELVKVLRSVMVLRALLLAVAVVSTWLPRSAGQDACTQSLTAYAAESFVAVRTVSYSESYCCVDLFFFCASTCYRTRYRSQTYIAYRTVSYTYTECCSGYGGTSCLPICSATCQNGGTCVLPDTCSCGDGWTGSSCSQNIEECSLGTHMCDGNATCADTPGSYTCTCNAGFTGTGMTCEDVDECEVDNGGCHHNCHNLVGSYTCSCNGGYVLNADQRTCEVPPPVPTNLQVLGFDDVSVSLEWQAPQIDFLNSLTQVSQYQIIATQETFAIPNITVTIGASETAYTLEMLEEYVSYRCTVQAGNSFGFGSESSSVQFTTQQAAPSAPPQNLSGNALSPTQITLSWSPPPAIDINGVLLYYDIAVTELETGQQSTLILLSSTEQQLTVAALHPYYNYQFAVAAFTVGHGPYSSVLELQTLESSPTAAPLSVAATAVNSTSLSLTWEPPVFEERNGIIQQYSISVNETDTSTLLRFVSLTTELDITGLHPYYTYSIQVAAMTVGVGPFSPVVQLQLPQDAPATYPENFTASVLDSSTIALSWMPIPPADQNGVIQYYSIEVTETDTGLVFVYNSTVQGRVITGLHPYYIYECKVAAVTILAGPLSPPITAQTDEDVPSRPPLNISVIAPSPWTLVITWQPLPYEQLNGVLLGYEINIVEVTGAVFQLYSPPDNTSISMSIFKPFTVYTCKVAAFNRVGTGPFSSEFTVQTPEYVPTEPLNISVSRVNGFPTQLLVSWRPPASANGVITSYNIYCREVIEDDTGGDRESSADSSGSGMPLIPKGSGSGNVLSSGNNGMDCLGSTGYDDITATCIIEAQVGRNETYVYMQQLTPFQKYECYVAASTSVGQGNPSSLASAITDEATPGDPPQNFNVIVLNSTTVLLTWCEPSIKNGIITFYTVTYNITQGEDLQAVIDNETFCRDYTADALNEDTVYTFNVYASTRIGPGPGTSSTVRTDESYPHSPPTDVTYSDVGTRTVTISWSPPVFEDQNGDILYYQLMIYQTQFEIANLTITTPDLSYTETDLEEYNDYSFVVAAATRVGLGPQSMLQSFMTREGNPSAPPQSPSGVARSSTVISLQWSPPPPIDVNGVLTHYVVEVMETDTGRAWSFLALGQSLMLGSLHPYYIYSARVAAYSGGVGPFTELLYVRTNQSAPSGSPTKPEITSFSSNSASLTWLPPAVDETNGVITQYTISYTDSDTGTVSTASTNSAALNTTLKGLHPFYRYTFKVRAETGGGLGPYSTETTIQLDEAAPSGSPLEVMGEAESSTSVSLSWKPPALEDQNGIVRQYSVNVTETQTGRVFFFSSVETNILISALHPAYSYACSVAAVTTAVGPPTQPIVVTTEEAAPSSVPLNLTATVTSPTSVLFTWMPPIPEDANGLITNYILYLTPLQAEGEAFQLIANSTSAAFDLFEPYTTYTVAVAAQTAVGEGPPSPIEAFTTQEDAPYSPPRDVTLEAMDSSTLYISWTAPPIAERNGVIRNYLITILELETGQSFSVASASASVTVPSLHPYYTYICAVTAVTVEEGPYSANKTIRLPEDVPTGSPKLLSFSNITSTGLLLSWLPPPDEDQNGIIIAYAVNITTVPTGEVVQIFSNTTEFQLRLLRPYTDYRAVIAAYTSVGRGPYSTELQFRTAEDAPSSPPQNLQVSIVDSRTIYISWDPPVLDERNGVIRENRITVTELDTGATFLEFSSVTSATVTSLHPFYTYALTVSSFTVSYGPTSDAVNVTLPPDVPASPPTNVAATTQGPYMIFLTWEPPIPEDQNGIITGYHISVTALNTGVSFSVFTDATNYSLTTLSPHTTYTFSVTAMTVVGAGPISHFVTATTHEDGPTAGPTNVTIVSVTATNIHLSWDPPPEGTHQGVIRSYKLNVTELATDVKFSNDTEDTQFVLDSLHPFYIYEIIIIAVTVEEGSNYTTVVVQTSEAAPRVAPSELVATVNGPRSITLTWQALQEQDRNGIIQRYIIRLRTNGSDDVLELHSTTVEAVVNDLHPFTTYIFTVAAETIETGPFTDPEVVLTEEDAPSTPPRNIMATALNSTVLRLGWELPLPQDRNGIIRRYAINLTETETDTTMTLYTDKTSLTLSGLHPNYLYVSTIAAETVSMGPWSVGVDVKLPEDVPSSPPQSVSVADVGATSFLLQWSAPPVGDQNGVIRQYSLNISELNTGRDLLYLTPNLDFLVQNVHPSYMYSCSVAAVTVAVGPFSEPVKLTTLTAEPSAAPQDLSAIALSSASAYLMWSPPPLEYQNGDIIGYTVNVTDTEAQQFTTQSTNITVSTLKPFTVYSLTVAARTSAGIGPFSSPVSIKTHEDAPSASPLGVAYRNLTSMSVILVWSPPPPEAHNGIIRGYLVNVTEEETRETFQLNPSQLDVMLNQLHPFYHYSFRVSAATILPGPFSEAITAETLEDVPSGPPLTLAAAASDSTTLQVSWNPPSPSEQNGVIRYYVLNLAETETGTTSILTSNSTTRAVYSLHPYFTYQLSVAAVTTGFGPFSEEFTITMPQDAPSGPPQNVTAEALSPYAIFVTWSPPYPTEQNGVLKFYNITVHEVNTGAITMYWREADHTQMVISNLHPYYDYEVSTAATTVQTGVFSDAITVRTLAAAPTAAPTGVTVTVLNSTSVLAQWEPPEDQHQNGIIEQYVITVVQASGNMTFTSVSTELRVSSLHPSFSYWLTVAAVTVDVGPYSEAVPFTMHEDVPSGPPQNFEAAVGSSTVVVLSWEPPMPSDRNGNLTEYVITLIADNNVTPNVVMVQASVHSYTFDELSPFTNYSLTVAASTSVGLGPTSSVSIVTAEDAPSAPPQNVTAIADSSTMIVISWQPPPLEQQNGIVRSYEVSVYDSERGVWRNVSTTASNTEVMVEVVPFSTYSVRVAAVTIQIGVESQGLVVATPEDSPNGSPQNVRDTSVTSRSVTLLWEPPSFDDRNGVIRYYDMELTESETGQTRHQISNSTMQLFTELHPYYEYGFVVRAFTIGPGPYSESFTAQTLEEAPIGAPNNLDRTLVNSTHIGLSWEEPTANQINGRIRQYLISVHELETDTQFTLDAGLVQEYTIGSLHPYYNYEFSVAAVTIAPGPYTNSITIRTEQAVPSGPPQSVSVVAINSTAITVTWDPPLPEQHNGIITSYLVSTVERNLVEAESTITTENTYVTISELHPFYTYDITVAAITTGIGLKSPEYSITMPESVPSGPPQRLEGRDLGAYTIELTWEQPKPEDQNGVITSYSVTIVEAETANVLELEIAQTQPVLVVHSLHPYYTYQCSVAAATTIGIGPTAEVTVVTDEQVPTQAPDNINISAVGDSSAVVSWDPPPPEHHNGVIRTYAIIMIELETGDVVQSEVEDTTMLLNGLHPFNTYRFVIAARTIGLGPFSTPVIFQMPEAIPSAPVQDVTVSIESPSTVKISWLPPNPQTWNGRIVNYTVTYELIGPVNAGVSSSTGGTTSAVALPSPGMVPVNSLDPRVASTPIRRESLIIAELNEYHVYEFTVYLANSAGRSDLSNPVLQELPGAEPSGAPTGIQVQILSSTSVKILWMPPDFLEQNGVITHYEVVLTEVVTGNVQQYTVSSPNSSIHIEGLKKYGQYTLRVAAVSDYGMGPFSMLITFRTLQDVPGVPQNVSAELVNATSVMLTWTLPVEQNGVITEYEVHYIGYQDYNKTQDPVDGPHRLSVTDSDRQLGALVTELMTGLIYEFMVRARTTIGYGDFSSPAVIKLPLPDEVPESSSDQSSGAVVATVVPIVLGVLVLVVIVILALVIFRWYRSRKRKTSYDVATNRARVNSRTYELSNWVVANKKTESEAEEGESQTQVEIEDETKAIADE